MPNFAFSHVMSWSRMCPLLNPASENSYVLSRDNECPLTSKRRSKAAIPLSTHPALCSHMNERRP